MIWGCYGNALLRENGPKIRSSWRDSSSGTLEYESATQESIYNNVIVQENGHCTKYEHPNKILTKSYHTPITDVFLKCKCVTFAWQVKEIVRHDKYRGLIHMYELDIAILVLNSSVVTGPYIMPVCVDWGATMQPEHNDTGYVSTQK